MSKNLSFKADLSLSTDAALAQFNNYLSQAQKGNEEMIRKVNKAMGGDEIIKVNMEFDADGNAVGVAKKVFTEFDKIAQKKKEIKNLDKNSLTSLRGQQRYYSQIRDRLSRTVTIINKKGKAVQRVNKRWAVMERKVREINRLIALQQGQLGKAFMMKIPGGGAIMSMANKLTQISFAAQGVQMALQAVGAAIGPIIQRTKQVQGMQLAFEGMGLTTEQAGQFMTQAKAQALQYGASLSQLEKGYKRVAPAVMNAGGSMQEVSDVMASISARTTTLGLNTEQTGRYIEAFAQVMGKGKLQGEELNQQFSELDGALRGQIASYLRSEKGINNLSEAMEKGEVTADIFREAFIAVSEDMRKNLAGAVGEVQSRIDELNVAQLQNIGDSLNTITLDSLRDTFGQFGIQMQSVILLFQQFFANIATKMPATQDLIKKVLSFIGFTFQGIAIGIIGLLKLIFAAIEFVIGGYYKLAGALDFVARKLGMGGLIDGIKDSVQGSNKALAKFTDSWLDVSDAAGATEQDLSTLDGRIEILRNKFKKGEISAQELKDGLAALRAEAETQMNLQEYDRLKEKIKQLKDEIKDAKFRETSAKNTFDKEKESLEALKRGVKIYFDEKKALLTAEKDAVKQRYDAEKQAIEATKAAMTARHSQAMSQLQKENAAIMSRLDSEMNALQAKTPAEKELAQLREQEIMDKLQSNSLSEKERLELTAQIERMQRQKQIEEKQLQIKAEKENAAKRETALAEQQKQEAEALAAREKEATDAKKQALDEIKDKQRALKEEQEAVTAAINGTKATVDLTGKSLGDILGLVKNQVSAVAKAKQGYDQAGNSVRRLTGNLRVATSQANQLAAALQSAAAAKGSGGGGGGGAATGSVSGNAFTGGNVKGGSTWTVNELGTEGFMDMHGRMKEINAPAWGKFRAPSSGTIIPAHIWSQLKASGQSKGPTAMPTKGTTQTSGLISALRGMGRPGSQDVVTNNVTIQSQNPRQDMVQALVTARRLKRVRNY